MATDPAVSRDGAAAPAPLPGPTGRATEAPPFFVVLGPDYAGKSSVLTHLAADTPDWQIVSTDDDLVGPEHALIPRLRAGLVDEVLPGLHRHYSPDFMVSLLQTAVVHLRDRIARCSPTAPVLVDSYYYKILAKCRLAGVDDHPAFAWWRSFPQPRHVFFLDVSAETAWRRSGRGDVTNPLEHYDTSVPEQASFERFQSDLRTAMWEEVRHLDVTVAGEHDRVARTALEIREMVAHELD